MAFAIASAAPELVAQDAAADITLIIPQRVPLCKMGKLDMVVGEFPGVPAAVMAEVGLRLLQQPAAQHTFGRKQQIQNSVSNHVSAFPCRRSFRPE